ncbi:hypothetical protein HBI56_182310 [Parastagonospora nodorum]|uniref:Uncharacterized protein n=1 Tax=Phaeosphaeria nodorum (strain SN15 / ATCC MYA-4574 / FGSC 10173) TaxID=321614 RepID=A0A7U2F8Z0_PHANO|nr:hypothetical protein HBH56_187720 [Parastagonospora nodorum]QRD00945.1 hypothetical protein JI435_164760 [Parastagonospora nodorum SN15]KAH3925239.1 hypothetical protein HBH54_180840 [Parastagonospora nodorum]KAH3959181.1 hypothetical protein HBH52_246240 [Parastagonospora nodorum]KAH3991068.1 hypothetical protein HBI10_238980 [Parastagonospora nodorum]
MYRDHTPVFEDSSPSNSRSRSRSRSRDRTPVFQDFSPSRSRSRRRSRLPPRRYPERGRTARRASSRRLPRKRVPHDKLSESSSSVGGYSRSQSRSRSWRGYDSGRYSRSRTPSRHQARSRLYHPSKKRSPSARRLPSQPPVFVDSPAVSRSRSRQRSRAPVYKEPRRSRRISPSRGRHRSLSHGRHGNRAPAYRKASRSRHRSRAPVFRDSPSPSPRSQRGSDKNERHFKNRGNTRSRSRGASPIYKIYGRVKISPARYEKSGHNKPKSPRPKSRGRTRSRPRVHQKHVPSLADLLGPTFSVRELKLDTPKPKKVAPSGRKRFTEEQLARIPHGDTRWPASGEEWSTPLILRYKDQGKHADVLYHLIHQNNAPEAREWLQQIEITTAEAMDRLPGKTLPMARIMNALNKKKLRPLSDGKRGKIWLLDEFSEAVWGSMKLLMAEMGAIRMMSEWEIFEAFGLCIKENNGDILLISRKFDENSRGSG